MSEEFSTTLALMADVFYQDSGVLQCQRFIEQLCTDGVNAALTARQQGSNLAELVIALTEIPQVSSSKLPTC